VAQRIVRAKRKIAQLELAYEVPAPRELPARLDGVLGVLYLVFNEGYAAHGGDDLVRRDLVHEALRLADLLLRIPATATPKTHALMALMLLQGARLPARVDAEGGLLTLADQDRTLWDRAWIRRGFHHFERSIAGDELSAFHVQASIASVHAGSPSFEATDWRTILDRYGQLMDVAPSPVVALNRTVALAMVSGPEAGLAELDRLACDQTLARYYLLPATRGELFRRLGELEAAADCFRQALALPCSRPERSFLERKLRSCRVPGPDPEPGRSTAG
jgi:RNA polymerase sigma-70 factor (ECF subfamily)